MKRRSRLALLGLALAGTVIVGQLAGCGNGGESDSTRTTTAAEAPEQHAPVAREPAAKSAPAPRSAGKNRAKKPGEGEDHPTAPAVRSEGGERHGGDNSSAAKARAQDAACPVQLSRRQCAELASSAIGGNRGGSPPPKGTCPDGLGPQACEELREAVERSPEPDHSTPTESCPPALPEQQCRELEAIR